MNNWKFIYKEALPLGGHGASDTYENLPVVLFKPPFANLWSWNLLHRVLDRGNVLLSCLGIVCL